MWRFLPVALNQAATLAFGVIGIILVTHVVPKPVYGAYGLFLTLTQVGLLLTHSGTINHATRYWQREQERAARFAKFLLQDAWRRSWPLAVVLLGISIVQAVSRGSVWLQLWPLLVASNLVVAALSLASVILNAAERHWALLALNGLSGAARAFLPVALALLLGATLFNLSLGYALHSVAVAAGILVFFRGLHLPTGEDPLQENQWRRELREFGRPFIWMGAGSWFLLNADRWVVAFAFDEDRLGAFNLAINIACVIPNMAIAGLLQGFFPSLFRRADQANSPGDWRKLARDCDRLTFLFAAITATGLAVLHFVGPHLVGWLISERYASSMPLLVPAGLAAAAIQVNQFQYLLLQGQHDSASMVRVMILLAAVRTAGSVIAAAISWPVFLAWLVVSSFVVGLLGRARIQRIAFGKAATAQPATVK